MYEASIGLPPEAQNLFYIFSVTLVLINKL